MNFDDTPEEAAFRAKVRAWLDANTPKHLEPELQRAGFASNGVVSEDPLAAAFAYVSVFATNTQRPARVQVSGDDRLSHRVPELHEEVMPAIATKKIRHRELTGELTLVVEPVLSETSRAAITDAKQHLKDEHRGFKSVYVGRLAGGRFPLRRLY